MRTDTPRIAPITLEEADEEQRALLEPLLARSGRLLNVFATLARKPDAAQSYLAWGSYALRRTKFDPKLRELAILRTGYNCRSGYEWAQHSRLAKILGMSDDEIERIKEGAEADGWSPEERLVLRATDEAVRDHFIGDALWTDLVRAFGDEAATDLVFVIGHYMQTSLFLNCFGVQLEDGESADPDLIG